MKLTSHGAALEVTGSQHVLEVNGKKILLDCGLFQGRRQEAHDKNVSFSFDPKEIDVMVLSHAHIDHSGNIPHLVKEGFTGSIFCSEATKDLCNIMLLDSAYIQESDAAYYAKKHKDTSISMEPLYTIKDAEYAMEFIKTLPFAKKYTLVEGVDVILHEAGHVLGSAIVTLEIDDKEDGKHKKLVFTGDLGRCHLPIINDPYQETEADYILTESTYGNRMHAPIEEGIPELERIINRTVRRGGKIIIPSFAFERTQELIYSLHILFQEKKIPANLPIFIDSPLASNLTKIFKDHIELYDEEIRSEFKLTKNPFEPHQLKHTASVDESKDLNNFIGPCIIISASGMCEAGRIRHHLKNNIEDPKNTIAIVGYMAENTLGRKLVNGDPLIKIYDTMYKVNAEVVILESFSAHADMEELDKYVENVKGLKKILLVHGEPSQSEAMAKRLHEKLGVETHIMEPNEGVEL